jgi:hypothetical protein
LFPFFLFSFFLFFKISNQKFTNWTELYDTGSDPWQGSNLASNGKPVPSLSAELWRYGSCQTVTCP